MEEPGRLSVSRFSYWHGMACPDRQSARQRAQSPGFTLMELLVVMAIVALISAFVGPRLAGSLTGVQTETAAKKLAGALRYARSQAVAHRQVWLAAADFDHHRLVVTPGLPGPAESLADFLQRRWEEKKPPQAYDLPETVRFQKLLIGEADIRTGLADIRFYPQGNASGGILVVRGKDGDGYAIKLDFVTGLVGVEAR